MIHLQVATATSVS